VFFRGSFPAETKIGMVRVNYPGSDLLYLPGANHTLICRRGRIVDLIKREDRAAHVFEVEHVIV